MANNSKNEIILSLSLSFSHGLCFSLSRSLGLCLSLSLSLYIYMYVYNMHVALNNDTFCQYNFIKILSSFLISVLVSAWNWLMILPKTRKDLNKII